jgi:biopolymer transport protein ExbB
MQNDKQSAGSSSFKNLFAAIVIPVCLLAAYLIFFFVLGNPANFEGNDPANHPKDGNMLGTIYKGGPAIVPILIGSLLILLTFIIERFLTIQRSTGRGSMDNFLRRIKLHLATNDINAAIAECDKQRGSLANVVKSGLVRYQEVSRQPDLDRDAKLAAIQKELEEATSLELPMLERNLVVISTIASIATLMGLLGTVIGMIRAFSAMANSGAPDAAQLSSGISEALINTALGIGTSAFAIIMYNFFTNKIDGITYRIEEAGFSIAQTFASSYNGGVKQTEKAYA